MLALTFSFKSSKTFKLFPFRSGAAQGFVRDGSSEGVAGRLFGEVSVDGVGSVRSMSSECGTDETFDGLDFHLKALDTFEVVSSWLGGFTRDGTSENNFFAEI